MDVVNREGCRMDVVNREGCRMDVVNREGCRMDVVNIILKFISLQYLPACLPTCVTKNKLFKCESHDQLSSFVLLPPLSCLCRKSLNF